MKRPASLILMLTTLCAAGSPDPKALTEKALAAPGFPDFLAVDGDTAWVTNTGRVEQWSAEGKQASVTVPKPCGAMAIAFGSLWVANCKGGNVYRIDTRTAKVQAIIPTGIANPAGELNIVAGAESVWAPSKSSGGIARINPTTNKVEAVINVDPSTFYLAFGFNSLWAVSPSTQTLQRIDPRMNAVAAKIKLGKSASFLAAGEGAVWVQEQGDGTIARIDPQTVAVTGRVKVGKVLAYGDIDTGGGTVWLRTTEDQTFAAIDPKSLEILTRAGKSVGQRRLAIYAIRDLDDRT